jgi:oxygen-independent coproporphyrinogen-3 oxidase
MRRERVSSLYLHFPFCRHLCNYCDFYKNIKTDSGIGEFESYLKKSHEKLKSYLIDCEVEVAPLETIYIGGGTPSLWGARGASFLAQFLEERGYKVAEDCEFTLEVNPGAWTEEGLDHWRKVGVNRFSLGIQSLDSRFLKLLDRVHNLDDVYETLNYFSSRVDEFSVDFMLGLPDSHGLKRDVIKELDEVLKFNPHHISLYILTVKGQYVHIDSLPDDEFISKEYLAVSEYLRSLGYEHYEVSNFARDSHFSKHNLKYWESDSVLSLGPSATGFIKQTKSRFKWKPTEEDFDLEELSEEEFKLEQLYMALRTSFGVELDLLSEHIGSSSGLEVLLGKWKSANLAYLVDQKIQVTPHGFLVLDSLMDDVFSLSVRK